MQSGLLTHTLPAVTLLDCLAMMTAMTPSAVRLHLAVLFPQVRLQFLFITLSTSVCVCECVWVMWGDVG
ncbi:hypothetical protein EDD21DRAFT_381156 [Dissophora ornata]|nr:hypothetical protein EDD21DRAFT_381156 [Dissophora ornata]